MPGSQRGAVGTWQTNKEVVGRSGWMAPGTTDLPWFVHFISFLSAQDLQARTWWFRQSRVQTPRIHQPFPVTPGPWMGAVGLQALRPEALVQISPPNPHLWDSLGHFHPLSAAPLSAGRFPFWPPICFPLKPILAPKPLLGFPQPFPFLTASQGDLGQASYCPPDRPL